jgi:LysR family transcriptional regulator, flagellar master operon regulator
MNLDELRTFLEVVDCKSLVAASRRLHVTPSTVTARINALEEEVGQKLLHRNKSGAELTSPGFKLKRYAEVMVQLWRQASYEVSLPKGFDGVCNVGIEFDLWRGIGEAFLDHVRENCPSIAVALWPGEQLQLDRWLNMGLIDIAYCYTPQTGENFANRAILDDELVLVSQDAAATAALDSSYVYVDHGDEFRRQHAAAFPGDTTPAVTIASSEWAMDHLLRTGGSGYLPRRHVIDLLEQGRVHEVRGAPAFRRRVYLVESAQTTQAWRWYETAVDAVIASANNSGNRRSAPRSEPLP